MRTNNKLKSVCVKALTDLSQLDDLKQIYDFENTYCFFQDRVNDDEFRIAVVGEFSSGKSTFINALLGKDVLQHATTETTAVLTRIVNVAKQSDKCNKGVVKMRNGEKLELNSISELMQYTTTSSEQYNVVADIESVEIYLPFIESTRKIVVVDTPGLNGVADGHREQTVEMVQRAHACIYLIQRRGLAESDIKFINYLKTKQNNFIFIQNFIDEIHELEGESVEQKLNEQRRILNSQVFNDEYEYNCAVCGISALKALASFDTSIKRLYSNSTREITDDYRAILRIESGFEKFMNLLQNTFDDDHIDRIQYEGTAIAIKKWVNELIMQISANEKEAVNIYNASCESCAVVKLERIRKKLVGSIDSRKNDLLNFVTDSLCNIQKGENKKLQDSLADLKNDHISSVEKITASTDKKRLELLEKKSESISRELSKDMEMLWSNQIEKTKESLQIFYQFLIQRVQQYSGIDAAPDAVDFSAYKLSVQLQFPHEQNEIERAKNALKSDESDLQEGRHLLKITQNNAEEASQAQNRKQSQLNQVQNDKEYAERVTYARSNRPQAINKKISYEDKEYRGGFGILDFFLGPKIVTKYKTVTDDTTGQRWDEERAKAMNAFSSRKDSIQRELNEARRRKEQYDSEILLQTNKNQAKAEEIQRRKERIISLENDLELKKKYALAEYINNLIAGMKKQINNYFDVNGDIYSDAVNSIISQAENNFGEAALKLFDEMIQKKLAWIDSSIQETGSDLRIELQSMQETLAKLKKIQAYMEEVTNG